MIIIVIPVIIIVIEIIIILLEVVKCLDKNSLTKFFKKVRNLS